MIDERFEASTGTSSTTFRDGFGNRCRRLLLPAGQATFTYDAIVTNTAGFDALEPDAVQHDPSQLPDDTLSYLLPSRYCPSDDLADTAIRLFGSTSSGWERADAIATWTHQHLAFGYGTSSPTKTAADALADRTGVCRDFAHLMITMCRALNIPARYVVGYLPDIAVPDPGSPMDFCAWTEAYLGHRWYTFDPRNHDQRRIGRTVIARGRDAADVAMTTTFGHARLREHGRPRRSRHRTRHRRSDTSDRAAGPTHCRPVSERPRRRSGSNRRAGWRRHGLAIHPTRRSCGMTWSPNTSMKRCCSVPTWCSQIPSKPISTNSLRRAR